MRLFRENQQAAASVVINLLGTYSSLAVQYPANKLETHRFNSLLLIIIYLFLILMHVSNFRNQLFSTWANDIEENLSTETCQRLVAAFQDHFNIDSPVLSAKQQRIVDFNFSLRRLLNEASMRLHQASLQLEEDNGSSSSNELMMVLLLLSYGNLTNLLVSF